MNARFVNKSVPSSMAQAIAACTVPVTVVNKGSNRRHQTGFSNTQIFKGTYRVPVKF